MSAARPLEKRKPKILCVDDEPLLLAGLADTLRREYEVITANGGEEGLRVLRENGPFAIVLSDYAMPLMNGAQFLARARRLAPSAIRMMLTGQVSLDGAIAAVNEGSIFRILLKPCAPPALHRALEDALEQARLVTADRELLERKLEVMSSQLLRAERLASLGTMAGAIGHELNNILTPFSSSVSLIREDAAQGKPPEAEDLEVLERAKTHLAAHARNLLDFARPDRKGGVEDATATHFGRAVEDAVKMLRTGGIVKHIEVKLDLPMTPTLVPLGRTEIEQVIVNLVKNAADALNEISGRHPVILISMAQHDARVRCTVADNGPGIPANTLNQIFEPFYTTKPPDRGTGLGLFVVKQIIERRGGTLSVSSEVNKGTTFTIDLPAALPKA